MRWLSLAFGLFPAGSAFAEPPIWPHDVEALMTVLESRMYQRDGLELTSLSSVTSGVTGELRIDLPAVTPPTRYESLLQRTDEGTTTTWS